MNFKRFQMKASALCVVGSTLVLGGFMTVNLAGCGGGGGSKSSTPRVARNVVVSVLDSQGEPLPASTLQLLSSNSTVFNPDSAINGDFRFNQLPLGNYTASVDFDGPGAEPSQNFQLVIVRGDTQNYAFVQGSETNLVVSGRIFQNEGNEVFANCRTTQVPLTEEVVVSLRDLAMSGTPIIASTVRPNQGGGGNGSYSIDSPYRPETFRVEVSSSSTGSTGVNYVGVSATATFTTGSNAVTDLDVCTNEGVDARAPRPGTPTPTPSPTEVPTSETPAP